jgi:predicted DNA-binding transcriptional regulator YafY
MVDEVELDIGIGNEVAARRVVVGDGVRSPAAVASSLTRKSIDTTTNVLRAMSRFFASPRHAARRIPQTYVTLRLLRPRTLRTSTYRAINLMKRRRCSVFPASAPFVTILTDRWLWPIWRSAHFGRRGEWSASSAGHRGPVASETLNVRRATQAGIALGHSSRRTPGRNVKCYGRANSSIGSPGADGANTAMGQRSAAETIIAILDAFTRQGTWRQQDLASDVGVSVPALRKRLDELSSHGVPLERQEDHPDVFWSVPQGWFPSGAVISFSDLPDLVRLLYRLPRSRERERLLSIVMRVNPQLEASRAPMITESGIDSDLRCLPAIEDAAAKSRVLRIRYFTASRGELAWREVSIVRIVIGPPARFVAVCHRTDTLKWFRLSNIVEAGNDQTGLFRHREEAAVLRFVQESSDGFRERADSLDCVFSVRQPESRWLSRNLLPGMTFDETPDGIRVTTKTSGVLRVARFVVGLGSAATVETPELRRLVDELARGALSRDARSTGVQ